MIVQSPDSIHVDPTLVQVSPERPAQVVAGNRRSDDLSEGLDVSLDGRVPVGVHPRIGRFPDDKRSQRVQDCLRDWGVLLSQGKGEVTAEDFAGVLGSNGEGLPERVRLGMALESLGIAVRRKRLGGGEKVRVYDLSPLSRAGVGPTGHPMRNPPGASAREG